MTSRRIIKLGPGGQGRAGEWTMDFRSFESTPLPLELRGVLLVFYHFTNGVRVAPINSSINRLGS